LGKNAALTLFLFPFLSAMGAVALFRIPAKTCGQGEAPHVWKAASTQGVAAPAGSREKTGHSQRVPDGSWGGRNVLMEVREDGAKIELACARGLTEGAIELEKDGSFQVVGSYFQERPGPQREGEEPEPRPLRCTGRVEGKQMELTLRLEDTQEEVGTFTLVLGQAPRLRKCR